MHVAVGVWLKSLSRRDVTYKNYDVTSWRSHSRLLKRAIVNVQAHGDRKITVYSYGFLFNCTTVGQASDSMTALT